MIKKIFSDLKAFKTIEFKPDLNIILADKSANAKIFQTRNSAGKTSLVEIIHFLLGSSAKKESIFRSDALVENDFGIEIEISGATIQIRRSGKEHNLIKLEKMSGDSSSWSDDIFKKKSKVEMKNKEWTSFLGETVFDLSESKVGALSNFHPTFRSLFPYFSRRADEMGFLEPKRHSEDQSPWDQQVNLSYLLGLEWQIPRELQLIRNREKALTELKKTAKGEFSNIIGTAAQLRTELAAVESKLSLLCKSLSQFRIHPQYNELQREVDQISSEIKALRDNNFADKTLISDIEKNIATEKPPAFIDVERVYKEIGLNFPDRVVRRFEEISKFHETVINNRKGYLKQEQDEARKRLNDRESQMDSLDKRRSEIMQILQAHGALSEFSALQAELGRVEADRETLKRRFEAAQQLESSKAELDIERKKILLRLQQDYQDRDSILKKAIATLSEIVYQLYGPRPGRLLIEPTLNGPEITIKIDGDRSKGIGKMEIFSFDMMLMKISSGRGIGPSFLIHDSHLFEGVDTRQTATALMVGKNLAKAVGRQYIVLLNSDEFPQSEDCPTGFDAGQDILPTRLDDSESGGLFGFRFK